MVRRLPDLTDEFLDSLPWETRPDSTARHKTFPQKPEAIGEFYWNLCGGKRVLTVAIPSKRGPNWPPLISSWTIDHENIEGARWGWDGDEDTPTLTPSLHAVGSWHGWVRNGCLVEA